MNTKTSRSVFLDFVDFECDGDPVCDGVLSYECYQAWLERRKNPPKHPEEAFRKAITGHCRGIGGRKPFCPQVEKGILRPLRKKEVWPCFRNNIRQIGKRGFQAAGYWEMLDSKSRNKAQKMASIEHEDRAGHPCANEKISNTNRVYHGNVEEPSHSLEAVFQELFSLEFESIHNDFEDTDF